MDESKQTKTPVSFKFAIPFFVILTVLTVCSFIIPLRPNFLSSKFLLSALATVPAVVAYPTFSVATLLVITLTGVLAFREKLKAHQWAALAAILVALVMLNV